VPINGSALQLRALHDTVRKTLSTLKNLDISTKSWDPIQCFNIRRKLSQRTLAALENSTDAPTDTSVLTSVLTFMKTINVQPSTTFSHHTVHKEKSCKICHVGLLYFRPCTRFQEMYPKTRRQAIIQVGECTHCLSTAHKVEICGSLATCRVCQQRHNLVLHKGPTKNSVSGAVTIIGYDKRLD